MRHSLTYRLSLLLSSSGSMSANSSFLSPLTAVGNNLLDTTKCDEAYYSYNEKQFLVSSEANVDSLERISAARILLMKIYYQ